MDFEGQKHVVVGAASGIGRAAAQRLASLGATVACADINLEGAEKTAAEIEAQGGSATAAFVDVTQGDQVHSAIRDVIDRLGSIQAMVNCAGITGETGMDTHEVDVEDFDHVYEVNLRGALFLSQAIIPHMVENGYGRILHVASISGKDGNAGMAAYSATKAGLIGLVKVMGKEYATTGVTVNSLAPAVIYTPIHDEMPEQQITYMTSKIPMGRTGTLDEAADTIAWIVSRENSFVTGFTFDLTGGRAVY